MYSFADRRKGRGNRAVSPAVAHVIMAAAVVAIGVSVLFWSRGTFSARQREASTFFSTSREVMKESLIIEDVWFYESSSKCVNVTVRNVGKVALEIATINMNGDMIWDYGQVIEVGKAATIQAAFSWDAGEHFIVVTTTRGNSVKEWHNISG